MNTNSIPQLDQLLKINDQLLGLPALPLVFIGCIAAGLLLKAVPVYPNNWIPSGVFATGILFNLLVTPLTDVANSVRALILGLIAGGGAWIAHRKVISKWITTEDLQSDTTTIKKSDTTGLP